MTQSISVSLWFSNSAQEAMEWYSSIFPGSRIKSSTSMVTNASICGVDFVGINGGPAIKINPSISFMVISEDNKEIDSLWLQLIEEGAVLMLLGSYPWSEHYGWLQDKYGVNWQFYKGRMADVNQQKIVPTIMFCEKQQGKCEQALDFYKTVFDDFKLNGVMKYAEGPFEGQVQHAQFSANGFLFMAMDSGVPQTFTFNEGASFIICCDDQEQIDYYWDNFTIEGEESKCGWCKDKFGISWQIIPRNIGEIMQSKTARSALMGMNKIIIADLK